MGPSISKEQQKLDLSQNIDISAAAGCTARTTAWQNVDIEKITLTNCNLNIDQSTQIGVTSCQATSNVSVTADMITKLQQNLQDQGLELNYKNAQVKDAQSLAQAISESTTASCEADEMSGQQIVLKYIPCVNGNIDFTQDARMAGAECRANTIADAILKQGVSVSQNLSLSGITSSWWFWLVVAIIIGIILIKIVGSFMSGGGGGGGGSNITLMREAPTAAAV